MSESLPARATDLLTRYVARADGLPLMQMAVPSHDGGPPHVVTFAPGDRLAFFTDVLIESCRVHAINKQEIEWLAAILPTDMTPQFEFDVNDTVIGYACLVCFGFRSPRFFKKLFAAIEANPTAMFENYKNDPFVSLVNG
jgi:hypothetical protein